jgi:hypothetical protein
MTTTIWLRVSSVIALLFALGHASGGLQYWSPMGDTPVLQAMRGSPFDIMGTKRTYFDFYMGFGLSLSVAQLMLAILLWQLSTLARTNALGVRPMIAVIALATIATGVVAWHFIFLLPVLFCLALVGSLAVAYVVAR